MNRGTSLLAALFLLCLFALVSSASATEVNPCTVEICTFGEVAVEMYVADSCEQNCLSGGGFMLMESFYTGNYLNVLWGEFNTLFEWTDYRVVDLDGNGVNEVVTMSSEESTLWADVHRFDYVDSQLVWHMTSIPIELTYWLDDVTSVEVEGDSLVVYGIQYADDPEKVVDKIIVIKAGTDGSIEFDGASLAD